MGCPIIMGCPYIGLPIIGWFMILLDDVVDEEEEGVGDGDCLEVAWCWSACCSYNLGSTWVFFATTTIVGCG